MSLKDTWTPQDTTMDASPDIPNMLADAIIQNESDIASAQSTAEYAKETAVAVNGQLADMNVAIQGHTNDIINTNIRVSQLTERVAQNENDIKELQESGGGGSGITPDELYSLAYYGDINIKPSDSNLFVFETDDTTMTASVGANSIENMSGDIVIPYEYIVEDKIYKVTAIKESGFSRTALTSVIIPTSVSIIDEAAFLDCSSLSHLDIPKSVKEIGDFAFAWNVLQDVVIPDSVVTIGGYAFHESTVKTLDLGESTEILKEGSFSNCEQLVSVTIPASLHTIEKKVFQLCESLTDVYFKGTKEQWDSITVESDNEPLTNATIHYDWSDGNGGSSEIVYVNISGTDGALASDKTFDEIYEAVQSGKTVVAIYGVERLTLTIVEPAILWFSSSFSTGDWNGKMRTLMCIKNGDADYVWGDHEINLAGTAYVDDSIIPKIEPWQPNTEYSIGQYVLASIENLAPSTYLGIMKCIKNHTSQDTFPQTSDTNYSKYVNDYWEMSDKIVAEKASYATQADFASKAMSDVNGNSIMNTYATKTELAETEAIAKGRATGYVFDTVDDMNTWLANEGNVVNLVLGDNLYIRAKDVPDYWWDGSSAQELEAQKVNLTEYATKEWSENYINETILGGAW